MQLNFFSIDRATPNTALAVLVLFLSGAFVPARGDNLTDPTRGDMVLFPGPLQELELPGTPGSGAAAVSKPVVMGLNIPGKSFRAGDGWWSLICDSGCRLSPARMAATPATHPVYDSDPTPSQILSWTPLPKGLSTRNGNSESDLPGPKLLAMVKPIRSLQGLMLTAGPVKTWLHQAMENYPAGSRIGTMEVSIPITPNTNALLVPRLRRALAGPENTGQAETMLLELRIGDRRQQLGLFDTSGIEGLGPVRPTAYLMWAGDLDGDGQLDLLVDFSGGNGRKVELFLSTLATGKDLVGSAGSFEFYDPSSAGC